MSLKCKNIAAPEYSFNYNVCTEALTNPLRSEELSQLSASISRLNIEIMNIAERVDMQYPNNAKRLER